MISKYMSVAEQSSWGSMASEKAIMEHILYCIEYAELAGFEKLGRRI